LIEIAALSPAKLNQLKVAVLNTSRAQFDVSKQVKDLCKKGVF
jgi:hypothetical protein